MNFVLDASVTMEWLLGAPRAASRAYALGVLELLREAPTAAQVPVTWSLEVANVLARGEARGLTTEGQTQAFLTLLDAIPITVDASTHAASLGQTLQIARRHKLSAYDASYLELAMRTSSPLASLDEDLLRAAKRAGVGRLRLS